MEIEILEREEHDIMDREEIDIEISHAGEATPSTAEVRDRISAELDLDPKTVEVRGIYSSSGVSTSEGTVRVHDEPIYDELPEEQEEEAEPEDTEEGESEEPEEDEEDVEGEEDAEETEDEEVQEEDSGEEPEGDAEEEDEEEQEAGS